MEISLYTFTPLHSHLDTWRVPSRLRQLTNKVRLRVLPGAKNRAGGNRARGRQPRGAKNEVYAVNTQVNRLTLGSSG
jgi:hypothetical protein